MESLFKAIKKSKYCVVFTGAGISTLSGLQDFRGDNGLYKSVDADKIFDLKYFHQDPAFYYDNTRSLIYEVDHVKPSIVHTQIAKLEQMGIVKAVITQNIDLLHTRAGSKNVLELHGSPVTHTCLGCGKTFDFEHICQVLEYEPIPFCDECQGIIKPDIVFFGEQLPQDTFTKAILEANKADLMLVLGSSLFVQPAASIPVHTLKKGGELAIINDQITPLDAYAVYKQANLKAFFDFISNK
jgi:NAD-dependent deacetylase